MRDRDGRWKSNMMRSRRPCIEELGKRTEFDGGGHHPLAKLRLERVQQIGRVNEHTVCWLALEPRSADTSDGCPAKIEAAVKKAREGANRQEETRRTGRQDGMRKVGGRQPPHEWQKIEGMLREAADTADD